MIPPRRSLKRGWSQTISRIMNFIQIIIKTGSLCVSLWRNDEVDFDPEEAINEISATALLTFREGMEYETATTGEDGEVILSDAGRRYG